MGRSREGIATAHMIYVMRSTAGEFLRMARPTKLGLTLEGAEAEEFCKNEASSAFTPEQLAFFRQAKKIYGANRSKF